MNQKKWLKELKSFGTKNSDLLTDNQVQELIIQEQTKLKFAFQIAKKTNDSKCFFTYIENLTSILNRCRSFQTAINLNDLITSELNAMLYCSINKQKIGILNANDNLQTKN